MNMITAELLQTQAEEYEKRIDALRAENAALHTELAETKHLLSMSNDTAEWAIAHATAENEALRRLVEALDKHFLSPETPSEMPDSMYSDVIEAYAALRDVEGKEGKPCTK